MDKTKCIAALFDFDGVVMDTETQYSIFWDEIGRQYFPQIWTHHQRADFDTDLRKTFFRYGKRTAGDYCSFESV